MSHETAKPLNSFKYVPFPTKKLMQAWSPTEPVLEIPWAPLRKPLAEAKVALISSAALSAPGDEPFDQQEERERPWRGDPSFRRIPREVESVTSAHLHINTRHLEEDMNCVFPLHRLLELESEGKVGTVAKTHYSIQGFILDPTELLEQSVPPIIDGLKSEEVDAVVLVPV